MKKKFAQFVKMFVCAVIAASMTTVTSARLFAADDSFSSGTGPDAPARAAITKIFKMPEGTPTPAAEFEFVFEKTGMNDPLDDGEATMNKMPDIPPVTISFIENEDETFIAGGVKYLVKQSESFITDAMVGEDVWQNGEGIYKYSVSETKSGITITDGVKETAVYSNAAYDVEIWVEKVGDGELYPKFVVVRIVSDSEDEYYIDGEAANEGKIDPSPGDGGETPKTQPEIEEYYSQVIFTNAYWKTDGGGLDRPEESSLEIIKKIDGMNAVLTESFTFTVKVTQPDFITEKQTYKAVVLDTEGNDVTEDTGYTPLVDGHIEIASGDPLVIELTNGQRLVYVDLHVGATVEAKEDASTEYVPSYVRTFAGKEEHKGEKNYEFGFPNDGDAGPHRIEHGAAFNTAIFTNNRTGATPTGISVDDLPYVVIIGMSVIGLAVFVAVKYRRKKSYGTVR